MPDLDPEVSPGQHAAEQVCGSVPYCGTGGQRVVEGRVIEQGEDLPRPWKARWAEGDTWWRGRPLSRLPLLSPAFKFRF